MIEKLLNENTIDTNIDVKTWQEAIIYGGNILEKAGCISKEYTDAMIDNVNTMGQYIVIAKGLAMPHARPEHGAKKIGLALITLKTPIPFGNKEYDPVDTLIFLCATDHTSHINVLSELMTLLDDDLFFSKLRNNMSKEKIIEYISQKKYQRSED